MKSPEPGAVAPSRARARRACVLPPFALALASLSALGCRGRGEPEPELPVTPPPLVAGVVEALETAEERPGPAAPAGWQRHSSKRGHYDVLFPDGAAVQLDRTESSGEPAELAWVELPEGSYHVSLVVHDVGPGPMDDIAGLLEDRIQWFAQSTGGKVAAKRVRLARGYPGMGADIRVALDKQSTGMIYVRVIRAGALHFELVVTSPSADVARAERFFESFTLRPTLDAEVLSHYPVGHGELMLGDVHRRRRAPGAALEHYTRAVESGAFTGTLLGVTHLGRADMLDWLGREDEAIEAYEQAAGLGVAPRSVRARRAVLLVGAKRYAHAHAEFDRLIKQDPADAESHRLRGVTRYALAASGATQPPSPGVPPPTNADALADLDLAVRINPTSSRGRAWRGSLRFELGDRAGARDDLLRATSIDASAVANLCALMLRLSGKQPRDELTRIVEWLAASPPAAGGDAYRGYLEHRLLAELQAWVGEFDASAETFAKARALRPGLPELVHRHAGILDRLGKARLATTSYARAHELDPDSTRYRNSLSWMLATSTTDAVRDGARAVAVAEGMIEDERYPEPAHVDTLAAAYAEAARWDDAVAAQRRAIELLQQRGAGGERVEDYEKRLDAYARHQPWREGPGFDGPADAPRPTNTTSP